MIRLNSSDGKVESIQGAGQNCFRWETFETLAAAEHNGLLIVVLSVLTIVRVGLSKRTTEENCEKGPSKRLPFKAK